MSGLDALLQPVQRDETGGRLAGHRRSAAQRVAARRLDADDARAEQREHVPGERALQAPGRLDDDVARERQRAPIGFTGRRLLAAAAAVLAIGERKPVERGDPPRRPSREAGRGPLPPAAGLVAQRGDADTGLPGAVDHLGERRPRHGLAQLVGQRTRRGREALLERPPAASQRRDVRIEQLPEPHPVLRAKRLDLEPHAVGRDERRPAGPQRLAPVVVGRGRRGEVLRDEQQRGLRHRRPDGPHGAASRAVDEPGEHAGRRHDTRAGRGVVDVQRPRPPCPPAVDVHEPARRLDERLVVEELVDGTVPVELAIERDRRAADVRSRRHARLPGRAHVAAERPQVLGRHAHRDARGRGGRETRRAIAALQHLSPRGHGRGCIPVEIPSLFHALIAMIVAIRRASSASS